MNYWIIRAQRLSNSQGHMEVVIMMMMKCQFQWWLKLDYREKTTNLQQLSDENFTQ